MRKLLSVVPITLLCVASVLLVSAAQEETETSAVVAATQQPNEEAEGAANTVSNRKGKNPTGVLVRPAAGLQHPDLETAWADYTAAAESATASIETALARLFDAAAAKGDLDAADKWQSIGEKFRNDGELPTAKETKGVVSAAVVDYQKAKDALRTGYEGVVKTLTIQRRLDEARAFRDEWKALQAPIAPLVQAAKKPDPPPTQREPVQQAAARQVTGTAGHAPMKIPVDAMRFNGHAYYCFSGHPHIDQPSAIAKCRELGGYLARIETQQEWEAVKTMLFQRGEKGLLTATHWIDGSDTAQEGVWRFSDGTPMTFFAWNGGEPNGQRAENCIQVENNGVWNDNAQAIQLGFICEWDVGAGGRNGGNTRPASPVIDPRAAAAFPIARRAVEELRNYRFVGNQEASTEEAKQMLQWLGGYDIVVEPGGGCIRCRLRPDQEVRIWPQTYGKRFCYGVRTKDPFGPPGQQEPYFEVCRGQ